MKKTILLLCFSFFTFHFSSAQGVWTWMNGSSAVNATAVYGTQGIASPTNTPPAVYEAAEWTDQQGNFWLFGGLAGNFNQFADLWMYNPNTNEWTWMKGNGVVNDKGNYGTQGVPATSNLPAARSWGVCTWVDLNGDLWMYGGNQTGGIGEFSDVWKYNIASNTWTWVQGTSTGTYVTYGTQGIPSPTNTPGEREECSATWVDSLGNLWLFGGDNPGPLNDLWKYDIAINEWTWEGGNLTGVYGNEGVPNAANIPPARMVYCSWKDLKNNFWLFGGYQPNLSEAFNDMWMYNPANHEWAWMSGSSATGNSGNYGALCTSSTSFAPGCRMENRARWTDDCGKFWLYGGAQSGGDFDLSYNDLWSFDPVTLLWTLASGSTAANITQTFGTLGVPNTANQPGGREGTVAWKRNDGTFYIFGGSVNRWPNTYNDLWRFQPDPNCPAGGGTRAPINLGPDTTYCGAFSRVLSTGYNSTLWSTGVTASQITVTIAGKYWATVNGTCGVASDTIVITANPGVNPGVVSAATDTMCTGGAINLTVSVTNSNIQWQSSVNGTLFTNIAGATGTSYNTGTLSQSTYYRVMVMGSCNTDSTAPQRITILPPDVAGTVSAMPNSVCAGSTAQLSVSGSMGALQWQSSTDGVNFTDINSANSATYTTSAISQPTYYRVKASNICGADSSAAILINTTPLPVAGTLTTSRDSICAGTGIVSNLKDAGSAGLIEWQSSTNGNNFSLIAGDTTNTYTTPHTLGQTTYYQVVARNNCGSDTSNTVVVHIVPAPSTNFTYTIIGNQVSFQPDSVTGGVISYNWDFGDGKTSNEINPIHTFDSVKTYYVCLTVYNGSNCSYTYCEYISLLSTNVENISSPHLIRLYPNPANNELTVEVLNETPPKQITITNDLGQTLIQLNIYKTKTEIDIRCLAAGMYFVKTQLADGSVQVNKLVKE